MNKIFILLISLLIIIPIPVFAQENSDLKHIIELKRSRLKEYVNSEMAIILDMAKSQNIINYFLNPNNKIIEENVLEEIETNRKSLQSQTIFWVNDIDKKFYYDSNDNYFIIDSNNPENYWYNLTLYETNQYNFNINYNPVLDSVNMWINVPVFDLKKRPIGIIGTCIDLTYFINNLLNNYSGKEEIYFFNPYGDITGARKPNIIRNGINIIKVLGDNGERILNMVKNIKDDDIIYENTNNNDIAISSIAMLDWYIIIIRHY